MSDSPEALRMPSRRGFLRLTAGAAALALLGCASGASAASKPMTPALSAAAQTVPAMPVPTPRPVPKAGRFEWTMQSGTPWETPLVVTHSGVRGPSVLVLGGVHGNEPGGWLAAEQVAGWQPAIGSLLVVPRANILSTRALERTLPHLGDLNRLYGSTADMPMAKMASEIIGLSTQFHVDFLLDMHESWGFYAERAQNGTAFLGQTISSGQGPAVGIEQVVRDRANQTVGGGRDRLLSRDEVLMLRATQSPNSYQNFNTWRGGTSSLSAGQYVAGLTPILVEMGQMDQPVSRRVELHLTVARALLDSQSML